VTVFGMALITAVATAVLAMLAVVTAWYARKAFREQSREVAAIEQQVKDEQEVTRQQAELLKVQSEQLELQRRRFEQDQTDQRRAQASSIYFTITIIWAGGDELGDPFADPPDPAPSPIPRYPKSLFVRVVNTSDLPVYDLAINWRVGTEPWGDASTADVLHPKDGIDSTREFPGNVPSPFEQLYGAVVRFRDAAGVHWLLQPGGWLTEEPLDE
jgi:type II secretory pathway pseudopilin PulG